MRHSPVAPFAQKLMLLQAQSGHDRFFSSTVRIWGYNQEVMYRRPNPAETLVPFTFVHVALAMTVWAVGVALSVLAFAREENWFAAAGKRTKDAIRSKMGKMKKFRLRSPKNAKDGIVEN